MAYSKKAPWQALKTGCIEASAPQFAAAFDQAVYHAYGIKWILTEPSKPLIVTAPLQRLPDKTGAELLHLFHLYAT